MVYSRASIGGRTVSLVIKDEILRASRMTEEEMRAEIALLLFQRDKLTLGQAAGLAGISRLRFQQLAAARGIRVHYDVRDFEEDIETLKELGPA